MEKIKVFIVEDDEWYRELLSYNLSLNPDYEISKFENGKALLEGLKDRPDVVTLDYRLPDMEGKDVLAAIKDFDPEIEVVVISEQESIETAVELLKAGAYDYLVKSKDIRERLLNVINNIQKQQGLRKQVETLQQEVGKKYSFENSVVGNSKALKEIFMLMEKAAGTNILVTLTGETGTGKEVVAKAIHFNSNRVDKPFVAVNMAAIPAELIESELFGHEKGAFTGANNQRIGKFEEAGKGTLFLDEIGEMDLAMQAKLLRALQEKEVTRIGSNKPVTTNCRIIVATNRNLAEEVKNKSFREDLYFRLLGLTIHLPPLRERDSDIIVLAKHFVKSFCEENQLPVKTISPEAHRKLLSYSFPGNVRELKSVIELASVMSNNGELSESDITFGAEDIIEVPVLDDLTLKEHTANIIKAYLKKYDNNVKLAADKLDIGFSTIYRVLRKEKDI